MTATDLYGLPISHSDAESRAGINDFIHGFISFQPKAANIIAVADAAPGCALANAYAAILYMLLEAPAAPTLAQPYLDRAVAASDGITPREAQILTIARHFIDGRIPELVAETEALLQAYPRDMAMLKLGQYHAFNMGDFPTMLRLATHVFPASEDIGYAHGMLAFGYEECHLLDAAETAARAGLALQPDDPWCHHAIAHVMLTQGRVEEGIVFLESVADSWAGLNSFMHSHNWWHLALFYLSRGRNADVCAAYDRHVWGLEKAYSQDQVGAVSLLARMEFAGVDVGDRWADVADYIAKRGADTVSPFLTLQYLYALARTRRDEANDLLSAVEARASETNRHDHMAWAEVALPAARAIMAHGQQDWDGAARLMAQALPRMTEIGGSHAQRDLFEQIHLDALIRAGSASTAQQVLEMRRTFDPDGVPLNRQLADIYDQSGLPILAEQARARAGAPQARA